MDGWGIWAIPVIASVTLLGLFGFSQEASAVSMTFTTDTTITSDATIAAGETWTIHPGVTLTIDPGVTVTVATGGTLDNLAGATITINAGGTINLDANSFIINHAASTLNNAGGTISSSGIIVSFGVGTNTINTGSITSNAGGFILNYFSATIANNPSGTITNDVGSIMINGFNSVFDNNLSSVFNNNGRYFTISSSITDNNAGGVINNGGLFYVDAANTLDNDASSFFNNNPGSILWIVGTLNNGGVLINDATSFVVNSGGGTMTNLSGGVMLNQLNGIAFNGAGSTLDNKDGASIFSSFGIWQNQCNGTVINNGVLLGTIEDLPCGPLSVPVIMAVGDIACDPENPAFNNGLGFPLACRQLYTSDIIVSAEPDAVLILGDAQYFVGEISAFLQSYDPTWGRVKSITKPSPGNHEYFTPAAVGYYDYFGTTAGDRTMGYYSFNLGSWHLISLNSNCIDVGGCGPGSPQAIWLENDLLSNPADCTLAYWHQPRFSSGFHGNDITYDEFWRLLHNNNADVVLVGHDHNYERFAPQDPDANLDAQGIRQFIVGTGGQFLRPIEVLRANSEVFESEAFGVLELTLKPTSYDWEFIGEEGESFTDSGTGICN